jgi:hypothetical protein
MEFQLPTVHLHMFQVQDSLNSIEKEFADVLIVI